MVLADWPFVQFRLRIRATCDKTNGGECNGRIESSRVCRDDRSGVAGADDLQAGQRGRSPGAGRTDGANFERSVETNPFRRGYFNEVDTGVARPYRDIQP